MDAKLIQAIENQMAEIDAQIKALEIKKQALLPEEYINYRDQYEAYYDDSPLSLRDYYRLMAEFEKINKDFDTLGFEAAFKKFGKRLEQLERLLAA